MQAFFNSAIIIVVGIFAVLTIGIIIAIALKKDITNKKEIKNN